MLWGLDACWWCYYRQQRLVCKNLWAMQMLICALSNLDQGQIRHSLSLIKNRFKYESFFGREIGLSSKERRIVKSSQMLCTRLKVWGGHSFHSHAVLAVCFVLNNRCGTQKEHWLSNKFFGIAIGSARHITFGMGTKNFFCILSDASCWNLEIVNNASAILLQAYFCLHKRDTYYLSQD